MRQLTVEQNTNEESVALVQSILGETDVEFSEESWSVSVPEAKRVLQRLEKVLQFLRLDDGTGKSGGEKSKPHEENWRTSSVPGLDFLLTKMEQKFGIKPNESMLNSRTECLSGLEYWQIICAHGLILISPSKLRSNWPIFGKKHKAGDQAGTTDI